MSVSLCIEINKETLTDPERIINKVAIMEHKATTKQEFITRVLNDMLFLIKGVFTKPYNGAAVDLYDICAAIPYLHEIANTGQTECKSLAVYETLREYASMFDNFSFAYDFDNSVITIEEN